MNPALFKDPIIAGYSKFLHQRTIWLGSHEPVISDRSNHITVGWAMPTLRARLF